MAKANKRKVAPPSKKTASTNRSALPGKPKAANNPVLPPEVYAHASVLSIGGTSLFQSPGQVTQENVQNFYSPQILITRAVQKLRAAGFKITGINGITISIAAPAETYNKAFQTKLYAQELSTIKEWGKKEDATFILTQNGNIQGTIDTRNTNFRDVLEGVAINEPVYFMNKPFAPPANYWHLNIPGDISAGLNADRCHRMGLTGRGVRVVMVDSGWYRHPYFERRGYRSGGVILGPATADPLNDESGHGTGESANLFAVAPDVQFAMVKMNFADSAGAFNAAVALNPKVISCSWGSHKPSGPLTGHDLVLSAAVANAVVKGITVVCAAGNGQWGFPGQHPDVISAGGVFMDENINLQASDYASGFSSTIYHGRNVPDVCGLVGMLPRARYIMLPVQPGNSLDRGSSGGAFPNSDETSDSDGWAAFSGTSAAAPQIAGVCALLKQARPYLNPAQIKFILKSTAIDVATGACSPATGANAATAGPDLATGYGLVNAHAALMRVL
jgi:subtilisin family serine protease